MTEQERIVFLELRLHEAERTIEALLLGVKSLENRVLDLELRARGELSA